MSDNKTLRNWILIIAILVVFALISALWSTLIGGVSLPTVGGGGSTTNVPVEVLPIHLDIPPEINLLGLATVPTTLPEINAPGLIETEGQEVTMSPFVALGALAAFFIGGIVVNGALLAAIYAFIERVTTNTKESDEFKENASKLEATQKERMKAANENRDVTSPDHDKSNWLTVSTAGTIIFFVWAIGMVINGTIFPIGEVILESGELVYTTPIVVGILVAVSAVVLAILARPSWFKEEESDTRSIPWDALAVLFTGLIIVGLGIGAMWFLIGQNAA